MSLLSKVAFYPRSVLLRLRIAGTRSLLRGPFAWYALKELGVPGHGIDLIRLDFPPEPDRPPRWGHGAGAHAEVARLLDSTEAEQLRLLERCLTHAGAWRGWPAHEDTTTPALPWRENPFLGSVDELTMYGMLRELRPERYVEIGSGISTRIAWQARRDGGFPMEIVSIDPEPRVNVAGLCDRVDRRRLEDVEDSWMSLITANTVVFLDGSHRCFPNSDVTVFFLEMLPRLPSGTTVHVHDVYLPNDYPAHLLERHWSEQYVLAAYLLGGGGGEARGIDILLPCAHLGSKPAARDLFKRATDGVVDGNDGSSFWMRRR